MTQPWDAAMLVRLTGSMALVRYDADTLVIEVDDPDCNVELTRDNVEVLRDALTGWLEEAKA